jgi:hypothetical protein
LNPPPRPNGETPLWEEVIDDMKARDDMGSLRYKTRLQPFNGRDFALDAYEEALDKCVYLKGLSKEWLRVRAFLVRVADNWSIPLEVREEARRLLG